MDNKINNDEAKRNARRKFLKRTSAGAILASLPAASVWGQDSLIAGSIAASGTGSDYAGTTALAILSPGKWQKSGGDWGRVPKSTKFSAVTNAAPIGYFGTDTMKDDDGKELSYIECLNLTLLDVVSSPGGTSGNNGNIKGKYAGPGNINRYIAMMILNAENHGKSIGGEWIHFPILKNCVTEPYSFENPQGLFEDCYDFGRYLYGKAKSGPNAVALELESFLNGNHA